MTWLGAVRALLFAAILSTNAAFVPGDDAPIVVTGATPRAVRVVEPARAGSWRMLRDRDTGVIVRMWGGAIPTPGAEGDPSIAERAARSFVAAHDLAPGARDTDLVVIANQRDGTLRTVAFQQLAGGMRVVGGQVHVVFARDRLIAAGSEALPHVRVAVPRAGRASLVRARTWLRDGLGPVVVRATGERVVLPIVRGRGEVAYHVADVAEASGIGPERWDVYVAPDGAPLARVRRGARATATLRFDVPERHPASTRAPVPAARASLVADATPTATDDVGVFGWAGEAPASVTVTATGSLARVIDAGGLAAVQATAPPGGVIDASLADDERGDAQLTAYAWAMLGKAHARRMHPTLAWLDGTLELHVNLAGDCNAMSTGDSLHFFRRSAECENTARLADVVLHELAHSLHFQSIIPGAGAFDAAMSEGLADFFAAHVTGDPGVGRGMRFDDTPVRELDPPGFERVFPDDVSGIPHTTGLILAGALWDLRSALIAELGAAEATAVLERIFVGILQRAADLPTSYPAALLADDDDGDLGNGTPHECAIEAAFGRHGLVPGFATTTLAPPVVTGREIAVTVTTPATPCPRPRVSRMTLAWHTGDGSPDELALTAAGDTWTATLPLQPAGTVVRYALEAELDDGTLVRFPDNPADPEYQLFFGPATTLWCERLDADPPWPRSGWEWATPFGRAGDAPAPFTGVRILGTNITGDGRYAAGTTATLEVPAFDASGYERVHLQFRRWLTAEAGDRAAVTADGEVVWSSSDELDHVDREWRLVDIPLPARTDLRLAWTLAADAEGQLGGWNVDDICVVALGRRATCGDGLVDIGESCDDGNTADGDGCSAACELEGGGCCSGSDGTGSLLLGLATLLGLRRRPRFRPDTGQN
jgi:cysteine-rich repeat protein